MVLESGEEDWDRLFAGMALYCTYSRSRWADAQHAEEIIYDFSADGEGDELEAPIPTARGTRYWRDNCELGKTMEGGERQVRPDVGGTSSICQLLTISTGLQSGHWGVTRQVDGFDISSNQAELKQPQGGSLLTPSKLRA